MHIFGIILAITLALSVYGGFNYYLYRKATLVFPQLKRFLAIVIPVLAGILILAQVMVNIGHGPYVRPFAWASSLWLGFIFLFFSFHLCVDLFWWLLGRHVLKNVSRRHVTLLVSMLVLIACWLGMQTARQVNITQVTINSAKLSAPVTVVQISDLHLGIMTDRQQIQQLVERINVLHPDLIVSTGDLIDMQLDHMETYEEELARLNATQGKYAVFGNHEAYVGIQKSSEATRRAGFQVLSNAGVTVGEINVVGVDDPAVAERSDGKKIKEAALLQSYKKGFTLLLKHQPRVNNAENFDLQLSGHTHGGQIFAFGLFTLAFYQHTLGLTKVGANSWLYLSRGAGTWGPPMRVLADPEITVIHLLPETREKGTRDVAPGVS